MDIISDAGPVSCFIIVDAIGSAALLPSPSRLNGLGLKLAGITMVYLRTIICLGATLLLTISISHSSAVTADVAKRCQTLMAEAFPPRAPGNPAGGSAKGSAQSQRDYFSKCIANGGNMDTDKDQTDKNQMAK